MLPSDAAAILCFLSSSAIVMKMIPSLRFTYPWVKGIGTRRMKMATMMMHIIIAVRTIADVFLRLVSIILNLSP